MRALIGPRTAAGDRRTSVRTPRSDARALRELADRHGLLLVEDAAARAMAPTRGDVRTGQLGDATAFSFYPTKLLGAVGEAGAVGHKRRAAGSECPSAALLRPRLAARRRGGGWRQLPPRRAAGRPRFGHSSTGWTALCSGFGTSAAATERPSRACLRSAYRSLPARATRPAWHQFVISHPERDAFRARMDELGVGTAVHYQPIPPELMVFRSPDRYPAAVRFGQRAVSLPFDSWLSDGQADEVCAAARSASSSRSKR